MTYSTTLSRYSLDSLERSPSAAHATSWFTAIPPERVGPTGEFDYNGLAKRVIEKFQQQFSAAVLDTVKVRQRGSVVVLRGTVQTRSLLQQLVTTAKSVSGAIDVETIGIRVTEA